MSKDDRHSAAFASLDALVEEVQAKILAEAALLKYPDPKILLLDMPAEAEKLLRASGYSVTTGTFGSPYHVEKGDSFAPVVINGLLPKNYTEKDIVVIDLKPPTTLDTPNADKATSKGEPDWWVSCKWGIVDPRPRLMDTSSDDFERILKHGGIFVVFAEPSDNSELILGAMRHGSLVPLKQISANIWSFLSLFKHFKAISDEGKEIRVPSLDDPFLQFLGRHSRDGQISCTLHPYSQQLIDNWISLGKNKFGTDVMGVIQSLTKGAGRIFIFPQLNDKPNFIHEFITHFLPDLEPRLFPHIEGQKWVYRSEYEIPNVAALNEQILALKNETLKRIEDLEGQIERERLEQGYLHDLLAGTGDVLTAATKKALETLGFSQVIDMDQELLNSGSGKDKREDLQIRDYSPLILIEVKGIAGHPKEAAALQVWKYIAPRMRELKRIDIHGLAIINHQRHIPPLERENRNTFSDDIITNAQEQEFGLLTTWDLYRIIRNFVKHGWTHAQVKHIFYTNGRIDPVPAHYQYVGVVEEFWERVSAVGVRVEEAPILQGDLIAFEQPIEWEVQQVRSLQVERVAVDVATTGMLAGIQTVLLKTQLRKGTRVFRVTSTLLAENGEAV